MALYKYSTFPFPFTLYLALGMQSCFIVIFCIVLGLKESVDCLSTVLSLMTQSFCNPFLGKIRNQLCVSIDKHN